MDGKININAIMSEPYRPASNAADDVLRAFDQAMRQAVAAMNDGNSEVAEIHLAYARSFLISLARHIDTREDSFIKLIKSC